MSRDLEKAVNLGVNIKKRRVIILLGLINYSYSIDYIPQPFLLINSGKDKHYYLNTQTFFE